VSKPEKPKHAALGLSDPERVDYLTVVAAVAYADKELDETELGRLRELCGALELSAAGVEKVVASAQSPDIAQVRTILARLKKDEQLRLAVLADCIVIAFADEQVADAESKEIAEFAHLLGISTAQAALLGRYVEDVVLERKGTGTLGRNLGKGLANAPEASGLKWMFAKLRRPK
jgi:uncharacterized tellurite resistance protein B-like protein